MTEPTRGPSNEQKSLEQAMAEKMAEQMVIDNCVEVTKKEAVKTYIGKVLENLIGNLAAAFQTQFELERQKSAQIFAVLVKRSGGPLKISKKELADVPKNGSIKSEFNKSEQAVVIELVIPNDNPAPTDAKTG